MATTISSPRYHKNINLVFGRLGYDVWTQIFEQMIEYKLDETTKEYFRHMPSDFNQILFVNKEFALEYARICRIKKVTSYEWTANRFFILNSKLPRSNGIHVVPHITHLTLQLKIRKPWLYLEYLNCLNLQQLEYLHLDFEQTYSKGVKHATSERAKQIYWISSQDTRPSWPLVRDQLEQLSARKCRITGLKIYGELVAHLTMLHHVQNHWGNVTYVEFINTLVGGWQVGLLTDELYNTYWRWFSRVEPLKVQHTRSC